MRIFQVGARVCLVGCVLLFVPALLAHDCGEPVLIVEVNKVIAYRITADVEESQPSHYELAGNSNPGVVSVNPTSQDTLNFGEFIFQGLAVGTAQLTFHWAYSPFGGTCFVEVNVVEPGALLPTSANYCASGQIGDPVNTYTGEFFNRLVPDLQLGGPMPLAFSRYYASQLDEDGLVHSSVGKSWTHNFDLRLVRVNDTIDVIFHGGRRIRFELNAASWVLTEPSDDPHQLIEDSGTYVMMDPSDKQRYRFDPAGRLIAILDRNANTHTLTYEGQNLSQVSDGLGRTLTFSYFGHQELVSVTDGTRTVQLFHDFLGNLLAVVDAAGRFTQYSYDAFGFLIGELRPEGNTPLTQVYDPIGRVLSQTDAFFNTTSFSYGSGITTVTDPLFHSQSHTHSAAGYLTAATDAGGQSIVMGYDAAGRRSSITDRAGGTNLYGYDALSAEFLSITDPGGAVISKSWTPRLADGFTYYDLSQIVLADGNTRSFTRDANGNILSATDEANEVRSLTYDGRGAWLTYTNPAGGVTTNTFNADGTLATRTDPSGKITTFGHDALRRLNLITFHDNTTTDFVYDNLDRLLSSTDELGNLTTFDYDFNGNLVSHTEGSGLATSTFTHDAMDRLVTESNQLLQTSTFTYTETRRAASLTDPNGDTVSFNFDAVARPVSLTDEAGHLWARTFNAEEVTTSVTDPLSQTTSFEVDSMGRVEQATDPLSNVTNYTYDVRGNLTAEQHADGMIVARNYDDRGLLARIDAPGISVGFARDSMGDVSQVTDPNFNTWGISHDAQGRVTDRTDPLLRTRSYSYDDRNRVSQITFPEASGTMVVTRDAVGNPTQIAYSDGTSRNYVYDAMNRPISGDGFSVAYDAAGEIASSNGLALGRDPDGRISSLTLAPGKVVSYGYDARDLVTSVSDWVGGTTTLSYDNARRLTGISRPNGVTTTFAYDAASRIIGISEGALSDLSLTRDPVDRVIAATRDVPLQPVASVESASYAYDAASQVDGYIYDSLGRLIGDGTHSFTWDLGSRLVGYDGASGPVTFTYDALNMRTSRTAGGTTRGYVIDYALTLPSISVVQEGGADLRYYVHTPGGFLLHSIEAADDSRRFYHFDEMGNTIFLTDGAGAVVASYAYGAYGEPLGATGSVDNPFTWGGLYGVMHEGDAGLYYIRARYYDSETARFLTKDPKRSLGLFSANPYAHAQNNPLRYIDPDGLTPDKVVIGDQFRGNCFGWVFKGGRGEVVETDENVRGILTAHFDEVRNPKDARTGDIIVYDYSEPGPGISHVAFVVRVDEGILVVGLGRNNGPIEAHTPENNADDPTRNWRYFRPKSGSFADAEQAEVERLQDQLRGACSATKGPNRQFGTLQIQAAFRLTSIMQTLNDIER